MQRIMTLSILKIKCIISNITIQNKRGFSQFKYCCKRLCQFSAGALEVLPKVDVDIVRVVYSITQKGKFESDVLLKLLIFGSATDKADQSFEESVDAFKASPGEFEVFKKRMDQIMGSLNKFKDFINTSLKT